MTTKRQILQNAIAVFARSTYHGATTEDIAEEAGVTEALIYRYFGSKRTLFIEAIDHTSSQLVDGLETILEEHRDDPMRAIRECFTFYARLLEEHGELAKMIFLVLSELDHQDVRETYLPYQTRALDAIGDAIDHWKELELADPAVSTGPASWLYFGTYLILALVRRSAGEVPVDPSRAVELAKPFLTDEAFEDYESDAGT
ncbi:MAG: TetR/AcrR family transcriptional regulator [Bradymonadaceae bacterium]